MEPYIGTEMYLSVEFEVSVVSFPSTELERGVSYLLNWCREPRQPLGIISGLLIS